MPAETPETLPTEETVRILLLELDQLEAVPLPKSEIVLFTQTVLRPLSVGIGLTVIETVFEHPEFDT